MSGMIAISDANFEQDVLKASSPVLVDFWAAWCGPCRAVAPILEEAAKTYAGRLTVAKLNVDENRDAPARYGIRGIPTLLLFKNGEVAASQIGAVSREQLDGFLNAHL